MTYTVYGAAGSGSVPVEAALTLIGAPFEVVEAVTWEGEAERDKVAPVNPMRQIPALVTPDGETLTESAAILIWLAERHPEAALGPEPCDPRRGQFLRWMTFIPASIYSMYWVRDDPSRLAGDDRTAQATITESAAILIWLTEQHPEAALGPEPCDPRRAQFLRWMTFVPASIYSMYWVRDEPSRLGGDDPAAQERILERTAERIADCWAAMESQVRPDRFLLGPELTVLDLYVAVASRWTPHRARFHEVAPRMGEVMRRVDALPELRDVWARRFPLRGRYGS